MIFKVIGQRWIFKARGYATLCVALVLSWLLVMVKFISAMVKMFEPSLNCPVP